jgi:hypothetical protein
MMPSQPSVPMNSATSKTALYREKSTIRIPKMITKATFTLEQKDI